MSNTIITNEYIDKLFSKIIFPDDYVNQCWGWTDYKSDLGYGKMRMGNNVRMSAHRTSYMILVDSDIGGLVVDHLCRNPECTNPNHLEAITSRENTLRGISPPAINYKKTYCINGHKFTKENTGNNGQRYCRICTRKSNITSAKKLKRKHRSYLRVGGQTVYRSPRYEFLEDARRDKERYRVANGY